MSNIAEFLQKILSARYGKDVRQSIHDAIKEVDSVADTAQNSATKAAEAARESEQASSLKAQEAEAFRNEAEQFRNEAALFTPDNYAEFVQTATETKERVDVLEENVETNKSNIEKVSFKVDTVIEKAVLRIKETASGESIHLTDSADAKVVEFALYGNAKQDGTPSPDNEVDVEISGASGNVVVKNCGAQVLNYEVWKTVMTIHGTSIFENNGVTITATSNDAYTNYADFTENAKIVVNEGDVITLSWEESSNKVGAVCIFPNGDAGKIFYVFNNETKSITYTVPSGVTYLTFRFGVKNAGDTISYKNIMINKGSTALPYEQYKETTATIPTPNGLAGIDVDSGGNYTDENGQQWICDEIIKYADGSGEYVQRIVKDIPDVSTVTLSNNIFVVSPLNPVETVLYGDGYCDKYRVKKSYNSVAESDYSIGMHGGGAYIINDKNYSDVESFKQFLIQEKITVIKQLATPIRTPLTAEQIAEIEKLQTFYPVTNIYNDADCGMKVTYQADSKNYIDKQLDLQKQAQEAAMINMLLLLPEETQAAMIENDTNNLLLESEV